MISRVVNKIFFFLLKYINVEQLIYKITNDKIVELYSRVTIGQNSHFFSETTIYNNRNDITKITIGNYTDIRGELCLFASGGEIHVGDYCYIGDHSRIWSQSSVKIGDRVLISHNVNIHDTNAHPTDAILRHEDYVRHLREGFSPTNELIETSPIVIADDVWIGFNSIILKGVTIGKGAIVASGSVVVKDIPAFAVVAGNPAKIVKMLI